MRKSHECTATSKFLTELMNERHWNTWRKFFLAGEETHQWRRFFSLWCVRRKSSEQWIHDNKKSTRNKQMLVPNNEKETYLHTGDIWRKEVFSIGTYERNIYSTRNMKEGGSSAWGTYEGRRFSAWETWRKKSYSTRTICKMQVFSRVDLGRKEVFSSHKTWQEEFFSTQSAWRNQVLGSNIHEKESLYDKIHMNTLRYEGRRPPGQYTMKGWINVPVLRLSSSYKRHPLVRKL